MATLLYGGSASPGVLRLRGKMDFTYNQIVVRDGKGARTG
jgi:hypothetical protein